jgi:hypothetical protein
MVDVVYDEDEQLDVGAVISDYYQFLVGCPPLERDSVTIWRRDSKP